MDIFRLWLESQTDQYPGLLPASAFVSKRAMDKVYRSNYYDDGDSKIASSRTSPAMKQMPVPVGTWIMEDWKGIHGTEIGQLRIVDPNKLEPGEDTDATKRDDIPRYAEWMKQGMIPPPVSVLETEGGTYRLTDGHRRWLAAKIAKVSIPAIVWPIADHPQGLKNGGPGGKILKVGLTYEIAQEMARQHIPVEFRI